MSDGAPPAAARCHRLRVVSWNIHGCLGTDRRYDPARIARLLEALDADIIGLQEVDWRRPDHDSRDQFDFIAAALGMNAVEGPNLHDHRGRYGNGLLTHWSVDEAVRIDLSCPGREPRGAIDAALSRPGLSVRTVVTHLGLRYRERRDQIARLRGVLSRDRGAGAALLLGDMNEWTSMRRLRAALTPRPFETMLRGRSFPSRLPWLALDCVFIDPAPLRVDLHVPRARDYRRASDHLPVVVDIDWSDPLSGS